jgi:hypothetical protein
MSLLSPLSSNGRSIPLNLIYSWTRQARRLKTIHYKCIVLQKNIRQLTQSLQVYLVIMVGYSDECGCAAWCEPWPGGAGHEEGPRVRDRIGQGTTFLVIKVKLLQLWHDYWNSVRVTYKKNHKRKAKVRISSMYCKMENRVILLIYICKYVLIIRKIPEFCSWCIYRSLFERKYCQ